MSDSWRPDRDRIERLARTQLSMTPGTAQGRVAQASPVRESPRQEDGGGETIEAIFSYPGTPVVGAESPPYVVSTAGLQVGTVIASTSSNTGGSTGISILNNGVQIAAITLPGGNRKVEEVLVDDVDVDYGDQITVKCTGVGAGLAGLTVQVLMAD